VDEAGAPSPLARVVLLGMMGAGKTTVGRIIADRLRWSFVDLDLEIERRAGRSIPEIFDSEGELEFRRIETRCTSALAGCTRTVLAPGGGWITTPGNLEALGPGTLTVWLQVSTEAALRRLKADAAVRPLLAAHDPAGAIRSLAARRDREYARADLALPTGARTPGELADEIVEHVRSRIPTLGDLDLPRK
jgi:shikimate kinase